MRGVATTLVFGAAMAGAATAQVTQSPPTVGFDRGRSVLVDRVVATVNDSAILESNLRAVTKGRIEAWITQHGNISQAQHQFIVEQELERLIDDRRLAKAAASLGPLTPDQVDQIVNSQLERSRVALERDIGVNEMSREFKRTNRTLAEVQNEQRLDEQRKLAEDMTVNRRIARQANLYVTPRMLHEQYEIVRKQIFECDAAAFVAQLQFRGDGAQQRAAEAAAAWRKEGIDARQLAERFPGATVIDEMSADTLSSERSALKQFALAGPEGAVSEPVAISTGFVVARVIKFRAARNGRFEDPDVQRELMQMCTHYVVAEFRGEAMARAGERTEVWRLR